MDNEKPSDLLNNKLALTVAGGLIVGCFWLATQYYSMRDQMKDVAIEAKEERAELNTAIKLLQKDVERNTARITKIEAKNH